MSQIIQIVKETNPESLSVLKTGDAKNAPIFGQEISTIDMLGLSWILRDENMFENLK